MVYEINYDKIEYTDSTINIFVGGFNKFSEDVLSDIVSNIQSCNLKKIVFTGLDIFSSEIITDICSIIRTLKAVFGNSCDIEISTRCTSDCFSNFNGEAINELMSYAKINTYCV